MNKLLLTCGLIFLSLSAWAQTRTITGNVQGSGDDGLVVGGVVVEKGTNNAVETDETGNFAITVSDSGKVVLIVSYEGFKTQEIEVGDQAVVNVKLEDDVQQMEDVVMVGYGTVKKSDLTGSVVSLKPDDVKQVPSGNVMEAIQGKAAGVDVTSNSGETGKAPNITVRGNRSISASNDPLYIVDGVQYSSIQDINPEDIQNMEVLKDASSTAIYGSRGSNGVIIITTKKGASGAMKVSVNSYMGVSTPTTFPRAMNAEEYAQLLRETYRTQNNGQYGTDAQALGSNLANYNEGVETNYVKELLQTGTQKDLQVGISGGTDKIKSYFSLDYFNQTGILKNDKLDRYTGRLNIDYQLNKAFKVGSQTQITYYDQDKRVNPLGNAAKVNPMTRPYDENGNIILIPGQDNGGKTVNPLVDEQPNTATNKISTIRVFPTLFAELKILKGLTARSNLAMTFDNRSEGIFNGANSYQILNNAVGYAQASHDASYRSQLNWQGIVSYNTTIRKDLSINAVVLSEVLKNKYERFFEQANGQLISAQSYYNLGDNASRLTTSQYSRKALVSFAGRLNLAYKGRYLLTLTGREDGASVLAEGKQWDFFPSIAGGWRLSDEKFMDWQKLFSTIKLRASWGIAGSANINPYSTQSTLIRVPASLDEAGVTAYTYRPLIGNTDTKWEKSRTVDIGLDLALLKDRITMGFDYYDTRTRDLLLTKKLPTSSGVSETVANVGQTRNRGVEFSLSSVNVHTTKFKWTSTLTFMRNKEEILQLTDNQSYMIITTNNEEGNNPMTKTVVVGHPVNSFFDYEKLGNWQVGEGPVGTVPGTIKIKDQNGDGQITPEDRVVVGSSVPKWSGGFSSEFRYKNFDLTFYLYARVGQRFYYQYTYNPLNNNENSLSTRDYWTPENPTNDLSRPGIAIDNRFSRAANYQDGSFLKLRNITLGYTLPKSLTDKMKISRLRVYATGKNLLIFNRVKDYDTEMEGSLTFPTVKLYVVGVNMEF